MSTFRLSSRPFRHLLLAAGLCLVSGPSAAQEHAMMVGGQPTPVDRDLQLRALKKLQRDLLWLGAHHRMAVARERQREARAEQRRPRRGVHARLVDGTGEDTPRADLSREAIPLSLAEAFAVPTNVRVNTTTGDTADAGQAEESIAALGSNLLVAWNDGQGFRRPTTDRQAAGWSINGGTSFTKIAIPHPAAWPSWRWDSDPVVTVNEKTGRFFYCGMATANASTNAIGVAYGHFTASAFMWDGVSVVRTATTTSTFLDKPWCVADSITGNVYVTNTTFDVTNHIDFYRSADAGVTWSAPLKLSAAADDGLVQGSRPCVGPESNVYVVWSALGPRYADFHKIRLGLPSGTTWETPVVVDSFYSQYGTGGPGYNREKGINFPSIAVDRTQGLHQGRIYVAWNETWNNEATSFTVNSGKAEVEPNNAASTATLFTPGQTLRGQISSASPSDIDWWKFSLTAGQSIVVWVDSLASNMTYICRIQAPAPDSSQRLCYGGDLSNPSRTTPLQTFYQFTAPATGTYYLRLIPARTTSTVGRYRVETAFGAGPGGYRARDQRDVFVRCSDDGGFIWAPTGRVNDDGVGFDDYLPEVVVGPDGAPYVTWFDFRNDTYGSRAHQYISRSPDGGGTWQANQRLTSSQGNFTTCLSNLMPNQGDYSHLAANTRYVRPVWADARGSNVDVWSTSFDTWFTLTNCPANRNVDARQVVSLSWTVNNLNTVFATDHPWTLTNSLGWPVPGPGTLAAVPAGGSSVLTLFVTVPDTCRLGPSTYHLTAGNSGGTRALTCDVTLTVTGPLGVTPVPAVLSLAAPRPNPAAGAVRLRYTLPTAGRVTLRVYGLSGELVRTLEDGARAEGVYDLAWDGRDRQGRAVASGVYFVRLEAMGRDLTRRLVWMR
jgi:hypothetical protein